MADEKLSVKAKDGGKVPYHDKPREYITDNNKRPENDSEFVSVPNISYYRRLVKEGSLVTSNQGSVISNQSQTTGARSPKKKEDTNV